MEESSRGPDPERQIATRMRGLHLARSAERTPVARAICYARLAACGLLCSPVHPATPMSGVSYLTRVKLAIIIPWLLARSAVTLLG